MNKQIKLLATLFIVAIFSVNLFAPNLVSAQTNEQIIQQLQEQIKQLKAQIAILQKIQNEGQSWCHTFNTNLKIDDRGDEVQALHTVLVKEGFDISDSEQPQKDGETSYGHIFGESTASAVTGFQEKYRDEILTPLGLKYGTGYVGKSTRAKLNQLYGCGSVVPTAPQIYSISPQSGPIGTKVTLTGSGFTPNQSSGCKPNNYGYELCDPYVIGGNTVHFGPATINAISYDGKNLSFVVPDGYSPCPNANPACGAFAQLQPGTYNVSVSNANGASNAVLFTVTDATTKPSIQVLSPNGGEVWTKGTTQTISWQDNMPIPKSPPCQVGAPCPVYSTAPRIYDLKLAPYYPPCTNEPCPMYPVQMPYTIAIADGAYGSSYYYWSVGEIADTYRSGNIAPDGSYTIQVCQSGTGICDSSDSYFKIVSGSTSGNLPPAISGVSGPTVLITGEVGKWEIKASDPEQGPLAYSVVWGDETVSSIAVGKAIPQSEGAPAQTATFTHVYSRAGAYSPTFTVTDNGGLSAKTSVSVNVSGGTTTNSPVIVLSPNGGEIWTKGTTQTIQWQDNTPIPTSPSCPVGSYCPTSKAKTYDIKLIPYYPPCPVGYSCPAYAYAPYSIASGIYGSLYSWQVGELLSMSTTNCYGCPPSPTPTAPDGSYTVQVCQSGTNICDSSDGYFKIVSGSSQTIIRTVGDRESSFLIQKINPDSVDGIWYQAYPVATYQGSPKTIHIGDDIGYACEGVSEKLANIDFSGQKVTFTKVVGDPPYGGCPICLSSNTLIDTPSGQVSVRDMRVGMPIWTLDKAGNHVPGIVTKTSKVPVPPAHKMVHLTLDDGRELFVSPGHPTVDGRAVGDLAKGDQYNGATVISTDHIPYGDAATYDILPSGETGFYWANGILIGSTLY